ncbi:MAG: DNA-binding protein [Candidatus Omnitrophota bacterium]
MTTLTVRINDKKAEELKVKAEQYGTPLEDLLIASMENLLSQPKGDFEQAMDYVLSKNRELYRRLA